MLVAVECSAVLPGVKVSVWVRFRSCRSRPTRFAGYSRDTFAPTCGPGGMWICSSSPPAARHSRGTGPAKVVRRQVVRARLSGELLNDVPGKLLGHAFAPSLASAADATEDLSRFDCRSVDPRAEFAINPVRNRDSPYVTAFAAQVYDRPMSLPLLEMIDCQLCDFVTPQSTLKQQG